MYTATGRLETNVMLKQYSPLVRRLAHQMIAKLPANVELDDLIQVGMIGLSDALTRFDAAQGVQFETFATQRIRGAMLDELRGADWMSRGNRKHQRDIEGAVHRLEQKLGRTPQESEIAKEMGITLAEYQELLGKVRGTQLVYLEDMSGDDGDHDYLDRHVADEEANPLGRLQDALTAAGLLKTATAPAYVLRLDTVFIEQHAANPHIGRDLVLGNADFFPLQVSRRLNAAVRAHVNT